MSLPGASRRVPPGPGQESVWDYPRPPRLERTSRLIQIWFGGEKIADSSRAWRVLETSHPPVYYIPPADVRADVLIPADGATWCKWKGHAVYFDVVCANAVAPSAAWSYPSPTPAFSPIASHIAIYPALMDECRVDGALVRPQLGGFYGGWITPDIVGPFKGEPGTRGW